jgi:hypothetical protein
MQPDAGYSEAVRAKANLTPERIAKLQTQALELLEKRSFDSANAILEVLLLLGEPHLPTLLAYTIVQSELGNSAKAEKSFALAQRVLEKLGTEAQDASTKKLMAMTRECLPGGRQDPQARGSVNGWTVG